MSVSEIKDAFNAHADDYDRQQEALRPFIESLHLTLRAGFSDLDEEAEILVVGAGTGAEVRMLARRFVRWRFTLVDPAEKMLAVAAHHAQAEGFAERCTFHAGYLPSLPANRYDAATSICVSHFITDATERRAYFNEIAARLNPGGRLFVSDLCADRSHPSFERVLDLWLQTRPTSKQTPGASDFRALFGTKVAVHGPDEVEAMMIDAGFTDLTLCCQALLIRAWLARRR